MWQIKRFVFSPIQENTYVLYNEMDECIIIDPGCYFDDERNKLQAFIEKSRYFRQRRHTHFAAQNAIYTEGV